MPRNPPDDDGPGDRAFAQMKQGIQADIQDAVDRTFRTTDIRATVGYGEKGWFYVEVD